MKTTFKDRYVLGEGYVDLLGLIRVLKLKFPVELQKRAAPKYRLVLEKVKP